MLHLFRKLYADIASPEVKVVSENEKHPYLAMFFLAVGVVTVIVTIVLLLHKLISGKADGEAI